MSSLVGLIPSMEIVLRNPFLDRRYPEEGQVTAVIDTGYEGFVALPRDVFDSLAFDQLQQEKRKLILANGELLMSEGTYGAFRAPEIGLNAEGFVETYEGLDEVVLGVEALAWAKVLLDYCARRVKVEPCP